MTVPLMVPVVNCANARGCPNKIASKTNPTTRRAGIALTTTNFVSIGFMAASMCGELWRFPSGIAPVFQPGASCFGVAVAPNRSGLRDDYSFMVSPVPRRSFGAGARPAAKS
jgi:hypothetical protein